MPENGIRVSDSARRPRKRPGYTDPHAGTGVEFFPLGTSPDHSGLTLYEAGYRPENEDWIFPGVFSSFWRLYFNFRPGHRVVFDDRPFELTPDYIMLIPDNQLFHCQGRGSAPRLWLHFSVTRPTARRPTPILLSPGRSETDLLYDLSRLILTENGDSRPNRIYHGATALLHVVLSRPEICWQDELPAGLAQTVRYIEQHYDSPLYVPRLAHECRA